MNFLPKNRYILVELQQEPQKEESTVLVPEGYKPSRPGYAVVKVLKTSHDINYGCYHDINYTPIVKENDRAIVIREMIEEIQIGEEIYFVILENHVLGILQ